MRLEWLEDILAVVDTGSLSEAAERRNLTQSAFSRRVRMIEEHVGVPLFDRARKPVQLTPATAAQEDHIRALAADLHGLVNELRSQTATAQNRIVIACQHAIATSLAPRIVQDLVGHDGLTVRLRSANLDACYGMLISREADLTIAYRTARDRAPGREGFFETLDLGSDSLIPVCAPNLPMRGVLPVIAYPADAYLGTLTERDITLNRPFEKRAETALTTSVLELAKAGVGVGWVPHTLAAAGLKAGDLVQPELPSVQLSIVAVRLAGPHARAENRAWARLPEIMG
ncbi:LysR family transcriptional regulator [Cognatishimia sp. MH4019]|uniref:LysR family transcriptional regulator n=1 Tax=Cognatishimia sp. MH4019 TaxID=2854030 RepID=UPI001CD5EF75|nr:LysR family transcriptional regulator [Cognatishimia sp. MH4019]